jgi:hypothetical protein
MHPPIATVVSIRWKHINPRDRGYYYKLAVEEKVHHYCENSAWIHYQACQKMNETSRPDVSEKIMTHSNVKAVHGTSLLIGSFADLARKLGPDGVDFVIHALR